MPRHKDSVPHGVIPAVLLPFDDNLSIDEASYRAHLRDVSSVEGVAAITTNAHASEVASCRDRKSTRLNSSHGYISYAVFCLKKKKTTRRRIAKPKDFSK